MTRRLRSETDPELRDTPVVLITAQSGTANTELGFAAGVTDYLTKPFGPLTSARGCALGSCVAAPVHDGNRERPVSSTVTRRCRQRANHAGRLP